MYRRLAILVCLSTLSCLGNAACGEIIPGDSIAARAKGAQGEAWSTPELVNGLGLEGTTRGVDLIHRWNQGVAEAYAGSAGPNPNRPAFFTFEFDGVYDLSTTWIWNGAGGYSLAEQSSIQDMIVVYSQNGTDWTQWGPRHFVRPGLHEDTLGAAGPDLTGVSAQFIELRVIKNYGQGSARAPMEVQFDVQAKTLAKNPEPVNGAENIWPDATVKWLPGEGAVSHDVYLGTDEAAVANATTGSAEYKGNQSGTNFTPGVLEPGQTYYWRIDEIVGPLTSEGQVWSFTVATGQAIYPIPSDDARIVPADMMLDWVAGPGAVSHDVYIGTDRAAVANAAKASAEYKGSTNRSPFDPGPLQEGTTYYWRVDEVSDRTIKGNIWSFRTVGSVYFQIDLALSESSESSVPIAGTAKEGWTAWASPQWYDMYAANDQVMADVDGTGVDIVLTTVYMGMGGLRVAGLEGNLAGGNYGHDGIPTGTPLYDPICNSWYQNIDWPENPRGDITLFFKNLPAGEYELYSYHNNFNCHRHGDNPTKVDCIDPSKPQPPMNINAMSATQINDMFAGLHEYGVRVIDHCLGVVTTTQGATNVQPQQITRDEDLVPSQIKFETDGTNVAVYYESGCCQNDDVRSSRDGGRAILNAFQLKSTTNIVRTAHFPSPCDGTAEVPVEKRLSFSAGAPAISHDIYLGTDPAAVENATKGSPEYKGSVRRGTEFFSPASLLLGRTYYWRIDENTGRETVKGPLWSFTTTQCREIEGFEEPLLWDSAGGAWVERSKEQRRNGSASMELQYYNRSPEAYSGAGLTFDDAQNFNGYESLGFYYKGEAGNQNDKLYAVIEDTAGNSSTVLSTGNLNLSDMQWQLWSAELTEFGGVDLANVKRIEIGVGTPGGSSSSAIGNLYIDDVGLCGGGLVPAGCACPGDLNNDTQIDLDDLQAVAGVLLEAGSPFVVAVGEGDCGDLNTDLQLDLEDLQAVAGILLDAGSPFVAPCE